MFSHNGKWNNKAQGNFIPGGQHFFPALSMRGMFKMLISRESWKFSPPDAHFQAWSVVSELKRPVLSQATEYPMYQDAGTSEQGEVLKGDSTLEGTGVVAA